MKTSDLALITFVSTIALVFSSGWVMTKFEALYEKGFTVTHEHELGFG